MFITMVPRDILDYARSRGLYPLIIAILSKIKRFVFVYTCFVFGNINLEGVPYVDSGRDILVRDATCDDLIFFRSNFRWDIRDFKRWLGKDYLFKIAEQDEEIIAYLSIGCHIEKPFSGIMTLEPGELWLAYSFTDSRHRGKNVYPHVFSLVAKELLSRGNRRVYLIVESGNIASLRSHEKLGFEKKGTLKYLRILGFDRCWLNLNK